MKFPAKFRKGSKVIADSLALLVTVIFFSFILNGRAQADITSQTVRPQLNTNYTLLEDASIWEWDAEVAKEYQSIYNFLFNTVSSPVTQFDATGNNPIPVVNRTSSLQGGGIWAVSDRLQLGFDLGDNIVQNASGASYSGVSDIRLMAKYGLWGKAADFAVVIAPEVYVPIQNTNPFVSNGVFAFGARLVAEKMFSHFSIAANAGIVSSNGATYQNINYNMLYPLGLGVKVPLSRRVSVNLEGVTNVVGGSSLSSGPGDLYLGTRIQIIPSAMLNVGASTSPIQTSGATSVRFLVGFDFIPHAKDQMVQVVTQTKTIETVEKIQTTRDCSPKPFTMTFEARPLTADEKNSKLILPYVSTSDQKIATLDLGQKTGLTPAGRTYVKDAQTLFAIDLTSLPVRDTVVSIDSLVLNMKVNKLVTPHQKVADTLCLLKEHVCSGDLYRDELHGGNLNRSFWQGKESPNDYFMKDHRGGETSNEENQIVTASLKMPLLKLTENSTAGDPLNLIYGKTIYFSVARNIYVYKKVELEVSLKIVSCSESIPEVTREIRRSDDGKTEDNAHEQK